MILKEAMYNEVEVSPRKPISKQDVLKYMQMARRTRTYVKFTVANGRFYIMVTYHRNGKVNLQSNIRQEQTFQRNIFWLESRGYAEGNWAEFIRLWINKFAQKNLR